MSWKHCPATDTFVRKKSEETRGFACWELETLQRRRVRHEWTEFVFQTRRLPLDLPGEDLLQRHYSITVKQLTSAHGEYTCLSSEIGVACEGRVHNLDCC